MMNIRRDDRHGYLEIELFGAYQLDRMSEVVEEVRELASNHQYIGWLEVHYGKPQNLFTAMMKTASASNKPEDYGFLKSMRRFALVSDNPGFMFRIFQMFTRGSDFRMKIFPMHERDHARLWLEEPYTPNQS